MSKIIKQFLMTAAVCLMTSSAFASSVKISVDEYLPTNFEFIFKIKSEKFSNVKVDCQGFINNVEVQFLNGDKDILVLDIGECEDIHGKIITSLQENDDACLMIDFDKRWYDVKSTCN